MSSYLFELAAIGGNGGSPFDHRNDLQQQGYHMGCGARSMRISNLHIQRWAVLSHVRATYTSWGDMQQTLTVPGTGNIKNPDSAVDIAISPDERVVNATADYGARRSQSGGVCLEHLQLTVQSVDNTQRVMEVGQRQGYGGQRKHVAIPQGLPLAGIAGRSGDSWDQVRLFVCPWLPGGGQWRWQMHRHYLQPFKEQVRTLLLCVCRLDREEIFTQTGSAHMAEALAAALFDVTFMGKDAAPGGAGAGDVGGVAAPAAAAAGAAAGDDGDYISRWIQQQVHELVDDEAGDVPVNFPL